MDPRNRPGEGYRALMAAYREGERVPPHVRTAAWERLQRELLAPANTRPPRAARRRDWIWGAALLAAAVVLLLLGSRQLPQTRPVAGSQAARDADTAATHDVVIVDPPLPSAATIDPPLDAQPPAVPPLSRPRTRPPAPRTREPAAPASHIDVELALLEAARTALRVHAFADALSHLAEHARRFSAGALVEERMRLEIEVRCAMGEPGRARAIADALKSAFPRSSHLPAVAAVCSE